MLFTVIYLFFSFFTLISSKNITDDKSYYASAVYCPSKNDLIVAYGSANLYDGGWYIKSGGAAATKASFNLLNGYVEFDIDFSGTHTGVNANIYTISPKYISSSGFSQNNYCDGAKSGSQWCTEVDWIETNGNCGGATTLHTREGTGNNGCTSWGCQANYYYNGRPTFHMRVEFKGDGTWTTIHDGKTISPNNLSPVPQSYDWQVLTKAYSSEGAVIYSSQWTGWVPLNSCGTYGDLGSSYFSVKNLRIYGNVVQGPIPKKC
jgi:hypothetical protein